MIDTPLEIFTAGLLVGAFVAWLALSLATGRLVTRGDDRIRHLRAVLGIIALRGDATTAVVARDALEVDAQEARRA